MAEANKMNKDSPYNLHEVNDYNESLYDYRIKDSIHYNRIPSKLRKSFFISIILIILGFCLFVTGILEATDSPSIQESFVFFIIGLLCLIPGGYYFAQFIRAKTEKDEDLRREIFDDIPNL